MLGRIRMCGDVGSSLSWVVMFLGWLLKVMILFWCFCVFVMLNICCGLCRLGWVFDECEGIKWK